MKTIDLREEVRKAIAGEWNGFATRHPHLAAVLDQTLLVDEAVASLSDDPEYRKAMEEAALAGIAAETVTGIVRDFVGNWLKRLV